MGSAQAKSTQLNIGAGSPQHLWKTVSNSAAHPHEEPHQKEMTACLLMCQIDGRFQR